jgi:hypothetical protein
MNQMRGRVWVLLWAAATLGGAACKRGGDSPESKFVAELKLPERPKADQKGPFLLKWNFKDANPNAPIVAYQFEHTIQDLMKADRAPMKVTGRVALKPSPGGMAQVRLDMVLAYITAHGGGQTATKAPPSSLGSMNEDGPLITEASQGVLIQTLFPLPKQPIAVGQHQDTEIKIPFTINTSRVYAVGTQRVTLRGLVKDGDRTLAELESTITVNPPQPTAEVANPPKVVLRGRGLHTFDLEKRTFVETVGTYVMEYQDAAGADGGAGEVIKRDNLVRYRPWTQAMEDEAMKAAEGAAQKPSVHGGAMDPDAPKDPAAPQDPHAPASQPKGAPPPASPHGAVAPQQPQSQPAH